TVGGSPYLITPVASDNGSGLLSNYEVIYNTAEFTVGKKTSSVTPDAGQHKTYGELEPTLTGSTSGFLVADSVTASYSRAAGETVGSYTISASLAPAGVLANYDITYNTASFSIDAKAASVSAVADSKIYGASDPVLTTTNSGFLPGDLGAAKITFSATRT